MSDPSILKFHIKETLKDIATQLNHASQVRGRARTGYYKVCQLLLTSILEVLLYRFIEELVAADSTLPSKFSQNCTIERHKLPPSVFGKNFSITETVTKDFDLSVRSNVTSMNLFCYRTGKISLSLHKKIKSVIDARNKIHLQGLTNSSRRYNMQMLITATRTVNELQAKVQFI